MIQMARVCSKRKCHYLKIVQGQKIPNLSPHNTHRGAPRSTAEHRGAALVSHRSPRQRSCRSHTDPRRHSAGTHPTY